MPTPAKTYRLLLVESRAMFRRGFRALLETFPDLVVVGEANDGIEALDCARELAPDVIVMDLHSPGSDVLQTMSNIRSELPHVNIIVLAVESDDPSLVYRAIRAGARGYIFHETEVDDLAKMIRLVAEGQAVLAPQSLTSLVNSITRPEHLEERERNVESLTARERDVLELVALGITNREIAQRLYVSESTVRSHMHKILDKLKLTNRVQAAAFVVTNQDERA